MPCWGLVENEHVCCEVGSCSVLCQDRNIYVKIWSSNCCLCVTRVLSRCISLRCFIAKDWRGYILSRYVDVAWHCKMDIVFLHLGSWNTLGPNWFWLGRSCVSRAMAKRSWPFGVTSWDDTVKFAQLLFGVDVVYENYAERLPHRSNKSFLLFAKGACAEGRPFFEIGDLIAPQLEEIQSWEKSFRNNNARPTKSQQMLNSDGWTVYYWSAQVTRAPCLCRSSFGADAHQKHVPTSSAMWQAGSRFEKLWDATLMKNYEAFQNRDLRPTWLDKSWQVLWNWNDHNQNHGISPHSDASATYSNVDPITSFSFGHGGVLTLGPKKGPVTRMLFQEGGDALVMAGDFQAEFCHGVPARSTWKDLKSLPMFTAMQEWEKVGLQQEIALHEGAEPEAKHVRMNCTVRWHSTHWAGCPVRGQEGHGTQPVSTGAVQTSSSSLAPANVSAGAAAGIQGTQPVVTGAVRVHAASSVDPKQMPFFSGIKKRAVEEEATPSVSTVKTSRSGEESLLEGADATIKSLLDCIEGCVRHNDLFTLAITGTPLVAATEVHAEMLAKIDENVKNLRARLLAASEAVEAFSPCNMRKTTSCGIAWLLTWRPFRSTALITTPTFMCSSHRIMKTTCTAESIPSCRQGLESS